MMGNTEEKKVTIDEAREDAEEFAKTLANLNKEEQIAVKNIMIGMNLAKETNRTA